MHVISNKKEAQKAKNKFNKTADNSFDCESDF